MKKSVILEYLKNIRKLIKQPSFYDWVLTEGRLFTERNIEREQYLIKKGFPHKQQECYYNAQMALLNLGVNTIAEYYEGWYLTDIELPLPLEHGFLVEKGKVLDLTSNGREVKEYF